MFYELLLTVTKLVWNTGWFEIQGDLKYWVIQEERKNNVLIILIITERFNIFSSYKFEQNVSWDFLVPPPSPHVVNMFIPFYMHNAQIFICFKASFIFMSLLE